MTQLWNTLDETERLAIINIARLVIRDKFALFDNSVGSEPARNMCYQY
jgi:hypothetical protein